jgi:protein TonB
MRHVRCALAVPLLILTSAWAEQNSRPPASSQTEVTLDKSTVQPSDPSPCPAKFNDDIETAAIANPAASDITQPRPTHIPELHLTDAARKELHKRGHFNAVVVVKILVDDRGIPGDVCLVKGAGFGLNAESAKAAREYRFQPATKDGKPIPTRIMMEMNFKGY